MCVQREDWTTSDETSLAAEAAQRQEGCVTKAGVWLVWWNEGGERQRNSLEKLPTKRQETVRREIVRISGIGLKIYQWVRGGIGALPKCQGAHQSPEDLATKVPNAENVSISLKESVSKIRLKSYRDTAIDALENIANDDILHRHLLL